MTDDPKRKAWHGAQAVTSKTAGPLSQQEQLKMFEGRAATCMVVAEIHAVLVDQATVRLNFSASVRPEFANPANRITIANALRSLAAQFEQGAGGGTPPVKA